MLHERANCNRNRTGNGPLSYSDITCNIHWLSGTRTSHVNTDVRSVFSLPASVAEKAQEKRRSAIEYRETVFVSHAHVFNRTMVALFLPLLHWYDWTAYTPWRTCEACQKTTGEQKEICAHRTWNCTLLIHGSYYWRFISVRFAFRSVPNNSPAMHLFPRSIQQFHISSYPFSPPKRPRFRTSRICMHITCQNDKQLSSARCARLRTPRRSRNGHGRIRR